MRLFDPRRQRWSEHFAWSDDGTRVIGRTPCGRATVLWQEGNRIAVGDRPVLYLNADDFAQWELRGTRPVVVPLLYAPAVADRRPQKPADETL